MHLNFVFVCHRVSLITEQAEMQPLDPHPLNLTDKRVLRLYENRLYKASNHRFEKKSGA